MKCESCNQKFEVSVSGFMVAPHRVTRCPLCGSKLNHTEPTKEERQKDVEEAAKKGFDGTS